MISISNLCKTYGKRKVLDDISCELKENFIVIMGPSGSGKSTLLNIMGTLDRDFEGTVSFDGVVTTDLLEKDLDIFRNKKVGFVFQNYYLEKTYSVFDNVALPLYASKINKKEVFEAVKKALEEVNMVDFINEKASTLSGGEAQRVAIARALVNNPEYILADEPTGSLDTNNGNLIMDLLKNISNDKKVIVVTHNIEHIKYAKRVIELKDGVVIKDEII